MNTTTLCIFIVGFMLGAAGMGSLILLVFLTRRFAAYAKHMDYIYNFDEEIKAAQEEVAEVVAGAGKPEPKK